MFGLIAAGLSIASLAIGAQGSAKARYESLAAGKIGQARRRTAGVREIAELETRMVHSGVEVTEDNVAEGSRKIGYTESKAGFFGIGGKAGGDIRRARDYSGATDTASLLLGTSKDAIRLDIDAIGKNAESQSDYYKQQTTGQILHAGATLGSTFIKNPETGQNAWGDAWDFLGGN